jgi:phosphoglucomutase/phosphomannomutase
MPGSEGMTRMKKLMASVRAAPPKMLAGIKVREARDYLNGVAVSSHGSRPLEGPKGDMVIIDLAADGNYVAVRPSGTEPKVKFYMFAYEPPEQLADLETAKADLAARMDQLQKDLFALADAVE